jgi:hypothetical protein
MDKEISIVRAVAPEDITPGTYVVELRRVTEMINYCGLFGMSESEGPLRTSIEAIPDSGPRIMRVEAVAVPLVLIRRPNGRSFVLDLRRSKLGVVPAPFAEAVFKAFGKQSKAPEDPAEDTSTQPAPAD